MIGFRKLNSPAFCRPRPCCSRSNSPYTRRSVAWSAPNSRLRCRCRRLPCRSAGARDKHPLSCSAVVAVCRRAPAVRNRASSSSRGCGAVSPDKHRPQELFPFAVVGAGFRPRPGSHRAPDRPLLPAHAESVQDRVDCHDGRRQRFDRRGCQELADGGAIGAEEVLRDSEAVRPAEAIQLAVVGIDRESFARTGS